MNINSDFEKFNENQHLDYIKSLKKEKGSKSEEIIKKKKMRTQKIKPIKYFKFIIFLIFFSIVILLIKLLFFSGEGQKLLEDNKLKLKICMCSIGKNENRYIKEFVNYYEKLGYTHIYIYDNNDINGERFEDIIQKEIEKDFVSVIYFRGHGGKDMNPQFSAYKDCYERYNHYYNWISFFDIDEYLELVPKNMTIDNFFNQEKFNLCQVIKLNWLLYKINDTLYYENKPLQERINIPLFGIKENEHIKSTVRGNLTPNYWSNTINPHTSINNFTTCSSSGIIINSSSPFNSPVEHQYAYIKHYHFKSFEELCWKIERGRPIPQSKEFRIELLNNLIIENKNNPEKMAIIRKIFNSAIYSKFSGIPISYNSSGNISGNNYKEKR